MIRYKCPTCLKVIQIANETLAGKMVPCPACKQKFRLPPSDGDDEAINTEVEPEPAKGSAKKAATHTKPRSETDADVRRKTKKRGKKKSTDEGFMALRNRIVGGVAMLVGMGLVIVGIAELLPTGAVEMLGMNTCKYASIGFGGLLTAIGVVYVIRG